MPACTGFFLMRQSVLITQLNGVDQLTDFATKLRELGDIILGESLQVIADFTVLLEQRQQIAILANGS
ncbi:Uncharacterised protein [Shigella sonnei]|nr:Uncharacterised protein [Shigella sonnei]CSS80562.1 Uncharacterised protein [Shigella sonnei]